MFRFFCVITYASAGLPVQRSIVRDDGARTPRSGPEPHTAERVQSLSQERQEVQASGSLVTKSTDGQDNAVGLDPADEGASTDNTATAGGSQNQSGGDALDDDGVKTMFDSAERLLKSLMERISTLSDDAFKQQKDMQVHREKIQNMRSYYNRLLTNMVKKMGALKSGIKGMTEGLNQALEASLTKENGVKYATPNNKKENSGETHELLFPANDNNVEQGISDEIDSTGGNSNIQNT